jgi:hypothetical protein
VSDAVFWAVVLGGGVFVVFLPEIVDRVTAWRERRRRR